VELIPVGGEYVIVLGLEPDGTKHSSLFDAKRLRRAITEAAAVLPDLVGQAVLVSTEDQVSCEFKDAMRQPLKTFVISRSLLVNFRTF
jgi:hypothetical protein